MTFARANTLAAWLVLRDCVQAREVDERGWSQAPQFKSQYAFADHLTLVAALEGRPRATAMLAGYSDGCWTAFGTQRQPNETTALISAIELARPALGDAEFDRLRADGLSLRDAQIVASAFSAVDV